MGSKIRRVKQEKKMRTKDLNSKLTKYHTGTSMILIVKKKKKSKAKYSHSHVQSYPVLSQSHSSLSLNHNVSISSKSEEKLLLLLRSVLVLAPNELEDDLLEPFPLVSLLECNSELALFGF